MYSLNDRLYFIAIIDVGCSCISTPRVRLYTVVFVLGLQFFHVIIRDDIFDSSSKWLDEARSNGRFVFTNVRIRAALFVSYVHGPHSIPYSVQVVEFR